MLALRESARASAVDTAFVFHGPAAAFRWKHNFLLYYCNIILKHRAATARSTTPQYYPGPSKTADIVRENRAS